MGKDDVDLRKWRKYGHRTRRRRLGRIVIMNSGQLADHLGCELEAVEPELQERGMKYHKDSTGEIWVSMYE